MPSGSDSEGLGDVLARLVDDTKSYVEAEAAALREVAASRGRAARSGAIMVVVAIALVTAASAALVFGILLILTARIGPVLATVVTVVATLLAAIALGWIGWHIVKRAWRGE